MLKSTIKICVLGLLATAIIGMPVQLNAQSTNKPATEKTEPKTNKKGAIPFHGKLKSVDKAAKTITVGEHTIQITSETKIMKDGKPATLEDGVIDETVAGAYRMTDDGKFHATAVRFGAKPEEAKKEKKQQ